MTMLQQPWIRWLLALLAINIAGFGAALGAGYAGQVNLAWWMGALANLASVAWALLGAWKLWALVRVRVIAAINVVGVILTGAWWLLVTGRSGPAIGIVGVVALVALFFGGLYFIRLALQPGLPRLGITGVARTVIDEALRMKVAMIFIVLLLIMVPLLPVILDPRDLLKYRIQSFLHWSLALTNFLLSLMTVLLACRTITSDVAQKQIFLTLTKPISRFEYLAGKWLGIVLLNLLLLLVAGGGIYAFTRVLAAPDATGLGGARDQYDRRAVDEQILVARRAVTPAPPPTYNMPAMFEAEVQKLREQAGQSDDVEQAIDPKTLKEISNRLTVQWHSIGPFNAQAYVFHGLDEARRFQEPLQLRLKPKSSQSPPDGMVRMAMVINGRPVMVQPLADDNVHVLTLPWELINEDGSVHLEIRNINPQDQSATFASTITFTPREGLQVLYRVGTFEGNLLRALLMIWVRLMFLAMLGLAAGTFLGFPVACLLSLMVFFTAGASGFLAESLKYYASLPRGELGSWAWITTYVGNFSDKVAEGKLWEAVKMIIALFGSTFTWLVPSFSTYNPVPLVSDGLVVSYQLLGWAALRVGAIWTGTCGLAGWLIFRKRELAKVTV